MYTARSCCEKRYVVMPCHGFSLTCFDVLLEWRRRTARIIGHGMLTDLGHDARLINPQFAKPYVKSNSEMEK